MKTNSFCLFIALTFLSTISSQLSTAFAQGTSFTYQGRVTDNGTNFTGVGQFNFALVTSTNFNHQATATANLGGVFPNYFISSCTLSGGGSGYVTAPAVTISGGGGSGATASASISGGVVTTVNILTPGSGYTNTPTVTVAAPPPDISYVTFWSNDGTSVAGIQPLAAVSVDVNDGLFTVVLGDPTVANMTAINASLFLQPNLQLRIWFSDGINGFAALNPVQNLTSSPYAVTADNISGTVSSANISGTYSSAITLSNPNNSFSGNGTELTGVNATTVGGISASGFWETTGNSGTTPGMNFEGTTDNQPFEVHVNGARALRLEPDTSGSGEPNVIGGSSSNLVDAGVTGAVIGGGGGFNLPHHISANGGVISGGADNTIQVSAGDSTIAGGSGNTIGAGFAVISGGVNNTNQSVSGVIAGGDDNTINSGSDTSTIGGGGNNTIQSSVIYATIPGGFNNSVSSSYSFAAGKLANAANIGSFVWSDTFGPTTSTANNQFMVRCTGGAIFYTSGGTTAGVSLPNGSGTWLSLSDRNSKDNFASINSEAVLEKVAEMPIGTWSYKTEKQNIRHIGPMAQDFYSAFSVGEDNKHIATIDSEGVALVAIQGLNQKVEEQMKAKDAAIQQLQETVAQLKTLVTKMTANQK